MAAVSGENELCLRSIFSVSSHHNHLTRFPVSRPHNAIKIEAIYKRLKNRPRCMLNETFVKHSLKNILRNTTISVYFHQYEYIIHIKLILVHNILLFQPGLVLQLQHEISRNKCGELSTTLHQFPGKILEEDLASQTGS